MILGDLYSDLSPKKMQLYSRICTMGQHFGSTTKKNPEIEVQFAGAMTGLNSINLYGQVHDYGWSQYSRIIDIGGSMGTFLFGILEANPSLQGVLFDRPIVIEKAVEYWNSKASSTLHNTMVTSGAVEFLGGSFFDADTLPTFKHNDVIVMRMILHDWIDEDCLRILRAIREAILRSGSPEVTLVLSELTPEVHDVIPTKFLIDLHMQVLFGAKERYRHEWDALFKQAGFEAVSSVIRTRSLYSLVITKPVL